MKKITLLLLMFTSPLLASRAPVSEIIAQKYNITEIDFEKTLKENGVKTDQPIAKALGKPAPSNSKCQACVLLPYSQGEMSINGQYCHVASYSHGYVVTVLDGPNYGFQMVVAYNGVILATNPYFIINGTPGGDYLRHEYIDCSIVTGLNQVMFLK
jgi:hypothetical protein